MLTSLTTREIRRTHAICTLEIDPEGSLSPSIRCGRREQSSGAHTEHAPTCALVIPQLRAAETCKWRPGCQNALPRALRPHLVLTPQTHDRRQMQLRNVSRPNFQSLAFCSEGHAQVQTAYKTLRAFVICSLTLLPPTI